MEEKTIEQAGMAFQMLQYKDHVLNYREISGDSNSDISGGSNSKNWHKGKAEKDTYPGLVESSLKLQSPHCLLAVYLVSTVNIITDQMNVRSSSARH